MKYATSAIALFLVDLRERDEGVDPLSPRKLRVEELTATPTPST